MNKHTTASQLSTLRTAHDATLDELKKYKLLVESVEDYAIFLMDKNGYIQTWNKGAQKNKGYAANEIIGKHFSTFYLPYDKAAKKPERELELATQLGRVEDEDWRLRKDGSKFWANVIITALFDNENTLVGFAKVTRDLTERKQHEDALRQNNTTLKKQQVEMEALNTSKDEFISLASHQLRTPATAIKQLLGMLLEGFAGEIDPKQLGFITKAYAANERQLRLVNNLLKVAQIDAGKITLRKSPVDLQKLFVDIVDEHAEPLQKKSQTVRIDVSPALPKDVVVDPDHIRMAFGNLIDNASKYSYDDDEIRISAHKVEGQVVIAVHDNGVGIEPKDMDLLFQKFSRIPNELSDQVGGSGLGLYWVNKVIAMHGGRIEVKSHKDKGTTFEVWLPLEVGNA